MAQTTVMQHKETSQNNLLFAEEYQQAIAKGFIGTYEQYVQYRDYT